MRSHTRNQAWRSLATLLRHGRWWQMDNLSEVEILIGGLAFSTDRFRPKGLKEKGILVVVWHLL